jgi:hypothetical protein
MATRSGYVKIQIKFVTLKARGKDEEESRRSVAPLCSVSDGRLLDLSLLRTGADVGGPRFESR